MGLEFFKKGLPSFLLRFMGWRQWSYEDLLAENNRLTEIVLYWRYPDGSLVPQRKRNRLFRSLHSVRRHLAAHPDNPNRGASEERSSEQLLKTYFNPSALAGDRE